MRFKKRADNWTWYRNCFTVITVDDQVYDITWVVYGVIGIILLIVFS